jgi:hypothetical protein
MRDVDVHAQRERSLQVHEHHHAFQFEQLSGVRAKPSARQRFDYAVNLQPATKDSNSCVLFVSQQHTEPEANFDLDVEVAALPVLCHSQSANSGPH